MKKNIYFLLVSTIMSSPLHAGTAGSVPMIPDVLDEPDVQESEYVTIPRASWQNLQKEKEELEKENNEIKQRTKVEEKEEKKQESREASLSSSFSSLSFENQGNEILLDREEELKKAKALSISLQKEKERKGKYPEEASSSSTSSFSISSTSVLSSEKQVGKIVEIEEKGMKSTEDTPAPSSYDLSLEENSTQPWLYPKLTELRSSIVGTLDVWFPDLVFKRKISEAGFDPQLIDLYKKFSPTFEELAQYRSDEVIQYKSLISKELFKAVLINISKDLPLLLKASADLGEDIGIYTFSGRDYTVDPYMYYAEWLYDGIGGFKKDEKEAFAVMYQYGSAGHEGVRRMHLLKSYRAFSAGSKENLMYFQNILQEYMEKNSEVANKIAKCFTDKITDRKKCTVMQLTISDLKRVTLEDLQQTTASNCLLTHLSKEKRGQIDRIQSLFRGENGYKKDPKEASQLSVEYGIFLAPNKTIKYQ